MKHIFVSPHFDDVALSCGGRIIANPARADEILVLNIFTSSPAESSDPRDNPLALFDSLNSERTSEDKAAWEEVGVRYQHANFPEALLRKRFPFRLFGSDRDKTIVGEIYNLLSDFAASHPQARFYFPAGFGSHVDHLACKSAAFRLLDEGRVDRVTLYEDVPYCWLRFIRAQYYRQLLRTVELETEGLAEASRADGESLREYLVGTSVPFPRGKKLFPVVYASLLLGNALRQPSKPNRVYAGQVSSIRLNDMQMAMKKKLIFRYKSQIPMLFGNDPDALLKDFHEFFSKEVTIEITRRS